MADAVRITGFSASTLRRYVRLGRLEALETPGGHLRFEVAALDTLLKPARPTLAATTGKS